MKNEIKRLKQEVISLMSRTQSNGEIVDITQP
jgi:flagellin-like hook-associated protein FlgL